MKRLKLSLLLILTLVLVSVVKAEDTIVIGETRIQLPAVEGFSSIGKSHFFYDILSNFVPPTNELLDVKIENSDIAAEVSGGEPQYRRYIVIQTFIPAKNRQLTDSEFNTLRQYLDSQYLEMTESLRSQIDELMEKGAKKTGEKYFNEMAIEVTDNVPLEIFHNQGPRFSALNLMRANFAINGEVEPIISTMGLNVLHIKGKVIYVYVYSESDSEQEREWVKNTSNHFSEALIQQ